MKLLDKTLNLETDKFKVIEFDSERYEKNNRAHLYYKIQCKKCGNIFSRKKEALNNFDNLKCRNCVHNRFGKDLNTVLYNIYIHYINNAKARSIEWKLNEKEFKDIIMKPCYYCNNFSNDNSKNLYSGVDRIDSTKGYYPQNCISCCKFCNTMKNKFSKELFLSKIKQIYHNLIKSPTTISKESTLQANGSGNRELLTAQVKGEDIV